jgi:hypothetical protein
MRGSLKVAPQRRSERVILGSAIADAMMTDKAKKATVRHWLTVLMSGDGRTILAQTISSKPPTAAALIGLFKRYIAQHAQVPRIVEMDCSNAPASEEIARWLVQRGCFVLRRPQARFPRQLQAAAVQE